MDPLEQVRRDQVLEAERVLFDQRPVEMIVLALLLDGADARSAERRNAEQRVQPLQDVQPARERLVADLQVLAKRIDGKRRPDQVRQAHREQLQRSQIVHALQIRDLLAHEHATVFARPALGLSAGAGEEWLRKAAKRQELAEIRRALDAQLCDGQRVHPERMVAALQRIAAEAVEVELGAARDQDLLAGLLVVVETLQVVPPFAVLVQLVERPQLRYRKLTAEDAIAVLRHIPRQVAALAAGQRARERRLPDLPRARDEDHLPAEIPLHGAREIATMPRHPPMLAFSPFV